MGSGNLHDIVVCIDFVVYHVGTLVRINLLINMLDVSVLHMSSVVCCANDMYKIVCMCDCSLLN